MEIFPKAQTSQVARDPRASGGKVIGFAVPPYESRQLVTPAGAGRPGWLDNPVDSAGSGVVTPNTGADEGVPSGGLNLSPVSLMVFVWDPLDSGTSQMMDYQGSSDTRLPVLGGYGSGINPAGGVGVPNIPGLAGKLATLARGQGTTPHALDSGFHTDVKTQANEALDILYYDGNRWDRLDNPTVAGVPRVLMSTNAAISWNTQASAGAWVGIIDRWIAIEDGDKGKVIVDDAHSWLNRWFWWYTASAAGAKTYWHGVDTTLISPAGRWIGAGAAGFPIALSTGGPDGSNQLVLEVTAAGVLQLRITAGGGVDDVWDGGDFQVIVQGWLSDVKTSGAPDLDTFDETP